MVEEKLFRPLGWDGDVSTGHVWMLDQRRLPHEEVHLKLSDSDALALAIREMVVRGAPAIGWSAALGVVLAVREVRQQPESLRESFFLEKMKVLSQARPTAVNLEWALRRMESVHRAHLALSTEQLLERLLAEADAIRDEDTQANLTMGELGAALLGPSSRVLTHCNAGALATSAYGTALGVIRSAWKQGIVEMVYADETRPYLQGARLTAWELLREGIPVTLITDGMAGHLMKTGQIDAVVVGSDRIARNGDVANKIGTYALAVLARYHEIPFYVAAPTSTVDLDTHSGDEIPIEERSASEVLEVCGRIIAPAGVKVRHPAFDVTPASLVTAIITERGVVHSPSEEGILDMMGASES